MMAKIKGFYTGLMKNLNLEDFVLQEADDRSLTPGPDARIGATTLEDWLRSAISAD